MDPDRLNEPSKNDWARLCGVPRSVIIRWQTKGLKSFEADLIACRIAGMHPSLIWTNWFDTAELDQPTKPKRRRSTSKRAPRKPALTAVERATRARRRARAQREQRRKELRVSK